MKIITPHGLESILSIPEDKNTKSNYPKKTTPHHPQDHIDTTSMVPDIINSKNI